MKPVYLDYNATTPLDHRVIEAMRPYLDELFGNPSSLHPYGTSTRLAVEGARKQVARFLNCESPEVVFTSGGTEANNMAIKGAAMASRGKGNHIITSSVEHPAVFEVCKYLETQGFRVTYLGVDEFGMVSVSDVEKAITPSTILITIMHANNEVGTIQPISEIAAIASSKGIVMHTDAAQSAGKIPVDVKKLGVDLLSLAGHKLYAPKGVGALYIRQGIHLEKFMHGADHEQNLRAGTENVLEIAGLGMACEIAGTGLEENSSHYAITRDRLQELLQKGLPSIRINGHPERRLPNTLSVSFPGAEANTIVARLEGVAASAGAACHSDSIDLSAVLEAMKVPVRYAMGTVRFSTGRENSMADIERAAEEIIAVASSLMPGGKDDREERVKLTGPIKLTHYTHGLGCACKIEPRKLEEVLRIIPFTPDERVLVGTETSDDATVYRIDDNSAIVQTLDFFTPIVDDPYHFGAIAAANALSDIYAMGAKPLFALNIVGFPEDTLPMEVLGSILKGAADKAMEAGINVLGGHTIEDPEPKYGMVVTGIINPDSIIRNHGATVGDHLVLTKPVGTGIITTALKRGLVSEELEAEVIGLMSQLNREASELMLRYNPHACTDVTGFGLLGHLREMTVASGVEAEISYPAVPFIEGARDLAASGVVPGGTYNNLDWVTPDVDFGSFPRIDRLMLCDAQTSGGLLIAVPGEYAEALVDDLKKAGLGRSAVIGKISRKGKGKITIR